jgi:hypothetical protein
MSVLELLVFMILRFVAGVKTVTSGVEDFCDLEDLALEAFLVVAMNNLLLI